MNLYEPGGALEPNNGGHTVLELCQSEGIGVLVNRPLNAFAHGRLIRLADFIVPGRPRMPVESVTAMLNPLREHERRFARELQ